MDGLRSALLILNACKGLDNGILDRLGEEGLSPDLFLQEGPLLWEHLGIGEGNRAWLSDLIGSDWVYRELDACCRMGIRVLSCVDPDFPEAVRSVPGTPLVLYLKGNGVFDAGDRVAMVGTRRCSSYGARCARALARGLAAQECVVVSGGALGIDGVSHAGTMEGGGRTFAVLGTGVDVVYPSEHAELFGHISENGLLVSQFPLGTTARPWRFPLRNRVVAALAGRLAVVEAPARSGALITARLALEMGREVWVVPGRIGEKVCEGSNRLLFDGAFPLVDVKEFVAIYGQRQQGLFTRVEKRVEESSTLSSLSPDEGRLLKILQSGGDRTIDNLAVEGKMAAADVNRLLMLLAARGLVFSSGPGRWSPAPEE